MASPIQINHYEQPVVHRLQVFFQGTGALTAGTGVCWVRTKVTTDTGETATDNWGYRDHVVDVPAAGREHTFAGVVLHNYEANAKGQNIYIALPGSSVPVYVNEAVTIGDMVNCIVDNTDGADNGQFLKDGAAMKGLGAAIVMQTGSSGNELVLARLVDSSEGMDCGMVQLKTVAAGAVTGITTHGTTFIPAATIASNATYTIPSGVYIGQRKAFKLNGAMTTSVFLVTVNGIQVDDTTALVTLSFDSSGEFALLEWMGDKWKIVHKTGATAAAT